MSRLSDRQLHQPSAEKASRCKHFYEHLSFGVPSGSELSRLHYRDASLLAEFQVVITLPRPVCDMNGEGPVQSAEINSAGTGCTRRRRPGGQVSRRMQLSSTSRMYFISHDRGHAPLSPSPARPLPPALSRPLTVSPSGSYPAIH